MTTVNCAVTRGYTFVPDANGQIQITRERLNLVALPTVTVNLNGQVGEEDLAAGAVSAGKLADAVADAIVTASATVSDEDADEVTVTLQVKDAQGNNLAARCVVQYWLADAEYGAPTGTLPSGGVSVTTGTEIVELRTTKESMAATDATGAAVLVFTEAGALTRYFNCIVGDKLTTGSQALTWTA